MHSLEHECITTTGASLGKLIAKLVYILVNFLYKFWCMYICIYITADIELVRKNRVVPNNEKMTDFAICMLKKHTVVSDFN